MEKQTIRKRAVRPTPEALESLKHALVQRWQQEGKATKLTRERRAELLGVSVATVDKLMARRPVDRPTLVQAFMSVGLPWSDDLCESPDEAIEQNGPPIGATETLILDLEIESRIIPQPHLIESRKSNSYSLLSLALLAIGAMMVVFITSGARQRQEILDPTGTAFNLRLEEATRRYDEGRYQEAGVLATSAEALAIGPMSVGQMAGVFQRLGDVAAAKGDFNSARTYYRKALGLRTEMGFHQCEPPLNESLGTVETNLKLFVEAKTHLVRALEGFRGERDGVGVAMAERDLGTLEFEAGNLASASRRFTLSIEAVRPYSKPEIEADDRARLALVWRQQGRLAAARSQLQDCLDFWRKRGHPRWISLTAFQLGTVDSVAGDQSSARALLTESVTGFSNVGDAAGAAEAHRWLSKLESNDKAKLEKGTSQPPIDSSI